MPKGKEQISKGYADRLAIGQLYKFSIVYQTVEATQENKIHLE